MKKMSLFAILAYVSLFACKPRENAESMSVDNRGNCKANFVQDYEKTQDLINKAYELGIGDSNPENQANEQAAQQACETFKTTHQNNICKAQDQNGAEIEMKAMDLNEECDYFIKNRNPRTESEIPTAPVVTN